MQKSTLFRPRSRLELISTIEPFIKYEFIRHEHLFARTRPVHYFMKMRFAESSWKTIIPVFENRITTAPVSLLTLKNALEEAVEYHIMVVLESWLPQREVLLEERQHGRSWSVVRTLVSGLITFLEGCGQK